MSVQVCLISQTTCANNTIHVTASRGVAVLRRDIGIDSNQTGGINEIKYRRRQQVIE